ncbi:MAG: AAA family ATPase [Desulfovibrio sp.]|nr:AAA family ATPase [Desulfovibrio sp.]
MQQIQQKLSVGRQNFRSLRDSGCVYVDKTRHIVSLLDNYESCFLTRPPRFGKSLTVSTIETLLSGKRQYFNGLDAAEEFLGRPTFRPRGVIKLDLSPVSIKHGVDIMNVHIFHLLLRQDLLLRR